jgi:ribosome maturation factor RimP
MKNSVDLDLLQEIVDDVVTTCGFSLVDLKLGGTPNRYIVRIHIYRREGVGVEDCATVSRELATVLEEKNLFTSKYTLEVSSPGADRILESKEEFELFIGREVKLDVADEADGSHSIIGRIAGLSDSELKLEVEDKGEVTVPLESIRKARLYVNWNRVSKRSLDEF